MALNLLDPERPLIDILRAALPPDVKVGSAANLVGRQNVAGLCPAVLVKPGPSSITEADSDPAEEDAASVDEQLWTVLVLVQFIRDTETLDADFSEAGLLMGQVYNALQGIRFRSERPDDGFRTLTYAGQQEPAASENGVMEFAVDFSVVRAFNPDPT